MFSRLYFLFNLFKLLGKLFAVSNSIVSFISRRLSGHIFDPVFNFNQDQFKRRTINSITPQDP